MDANNNVNKPIEDLAQANEDLQITLKGVVERIEEIRSSIPGQNNATVPSLTQESRFYSFEHLLSTGFDQFVDPAANTGVFAMTYGDWYQRLSTALDHSLKPVRRFNKHLLMKITTQKKTTKLIYVSEDGITMNLEVKVKGEDRVEAVTQTLADGWSHLNTKHVLVLHPTDPSKIVEAIPAAKIREWCSWVCDIKSKGKDLIVCCKKY